MRWVERRELERVCAPVFAEGTGQIRAMPGDFDPEIDDEPDAAALAQALVTPLTVLLAVHDRVVAAAEESGLLDLHDDLQRFTARGDEAMAAIHEVLALLRSLPGRRP